MRKYLVYGAKLLYGFLIVSVLYCMLYELITQNASEALRNSLLFLPVLFGCSIGEKKIGRAPAYLLLCFALSVLLFFEAGAVGLSRSGQIILVCFSVWIAGSYFVARATKKLCWLENPFYPVLILYLIICIYASYEQRSFLAKLASFAAGTSYLLITFHINDRQMGNFLSDYAAMERLPVQRMKQNNNKMFWIYSGMTAAVMMAAPYLHVEQWMSRLLKLLQTFLRWLFSFFGNGGEAVPFEQVMQEQAVDYGLLPTEQTENLFLKIIDWLLEVLSWMVVLGATIAILVFVLKKLLQLYEQFNDRMEENGDVVEDLRNAAKGEEKLRLKKESEEFLFFRRSADARIRKHYKKRVQKDNKEEIRKSWTPKELEAAVTLSAEQKEQFHKHYEKARYAKESCTKEEVQEMLRF